MIDELSKGTKFAEILGNLRRERGLSQRQVAGELGISQALLSHYENDAREPRLEFVVRVSEYYSVTTDYLLGRTMERDDGTSILSVKINSIVDSIEEIRTTEAKLLDSLRNLLNSKG
ncbi:MAG: helix-turn-helix domain-containing protein [Oscillospiraceae bacterium]|nr:helix-turn-helix domain-containing protein [Oscillospiraceae bacterium]